MMRRIFVAVFSIVFSVVFSVVAAPDTIFSVVFSLAVFSLAAFSLAVFSLVFSLVNALFLSVDDVVGRQILNLRPASASIFWICGIPLPHSSMMRM